MDFNSDEVTSKFRAPEPCGEYKILITEMPKFTTSPAKKTKQVEVRFAFVKDREHYIPHRFMIHTNMRWQVSQFLRACVGPGVNVSEEQFWAPEFWAPLVGTKEVSVDVGILRYKAKKSGRIGYMNIIANFISDKSPSMKLDPSEKYTEDQVDRMAAAGAAVDEEFGTGIEVEEVEAGVAVAAGDF